MAITYCCGFAGLAIQAIPASQTESHLAGNCFQQGNYFTAINFCPRFVIQAIPDEHLIVCCTKNSCLIVCFSFGPNHLTGNNFQPRESLIPWHIFLTWICMSGNLSKRLYKLAEVIWQSSIWWVTLLLRRQSPGNQFLSRICMSGILGNAIFPIDESATICNLLQVIWQASGPLC